MPIFSGRAPRAEYWWFFLAALLGSAAASLVSLKVYSRFAISDLPPADRSGSQTAA